MENNWYETNNDQLLNKFNSIDKSLKELNLQDIEGITSKREVPWDIDVYFIGIEMIKTLNT